MDTAKQFLRDIAALFGIPPWSTQEEFNAVLDIGRIVEDLRDAAAEHGRRLEIDTHASVIRVVPVRRPEL